MDKKLLYWAVALSCALLLMPAQMRAQAGLQTDADGSVTGTAGTEYLWVNAENFPDDDFRVYMLTIAKTAGGQKYVVPADITYLDISKDCCPYDVNSAGGYLIRAYTPEYYKPYGIDGTIYGLSTITIDEVPQPTRTAIEEQWNEMRAWYESSGLEERTFVQRYSHILISSVEEVNGVHNVYIKDTVYYISFIQYGYFATSYDEEDQIFDEANGYFPGPSSNPRLGPSHLYKKGNISDLTGIEHFANLRRLNCSGQKLRELDLTALTKLDSLDCSNNRLTDLKVNLVAHDWWDGAEYYWKMYAPSSSDDRTNDVAHQRVYLNCSNNYLTNLNNFTVTPTAVGQLVNIEGSYANNRILAFPIGKHPYYDLQQGIFAMNEMTTKGGILGYCYLLPSSLNMNTAQEAMFRGIGYSNTGGMYENRIGLYWHSYGMSSIRTPSSADVMGYLRSPLGYNHIRRFYSWTSKQNIDVNLSVIDKDRSRVGIAVPDNLRDEESRFEPVLMKDNWYPDKVKQGADTYYAYVGGAADFDYCHAPSSMDYHLFNGYFTFVEGVEGVEAGPKFINRDLSGLNINKYADWFDPNINTYYYLYDDAYAYDVSWPYSAYGSWYTMEYGLDPGYENQHSLDENHYVTLNADHYVMYVNPLSEDTEGLCNGTVVLDYDAIIPEGMEAFIVTSYTAGGESDRFKTGRLNLVKVGDGDCADGYKRVIPANNPVCLRTKQTVGEGQAADKMSTTGLYPFHRNNDRTLYPCPDPNDAQYEPLELIPSALFDGNKLRGVLDVAGQSYTAGDVLTLGRYKDNNEHKIGFWTYNGAKLNMHRVYVLKSELNIPSAAKGCTLDFGYDSTPTGIGSVGSESRVIDNGWYTLQGVRLSGKPAQSGIYIHNGKKVVVDSDNVTESGSSPTAQEEVYTDNF